MALNWEITVRILAILLLMCHHAEHTVPPHVRPL
jgi:hypothetical protein